MTKTLIKPKSFSQKLKQKPKPQIEKNQSQLPPNLQSFNQKFLSGFCFLVYNRALKISS